MTTQTPGSNSSTATAASAPRLRTTPRARRAPLRAWIARRVVLSFTRTITWGELVVRMPDGSEVRGGSAASGRSARVEVLDPRAFDRIGRRGQVGFGEAWTAGEITSPDLTTLLEVCARNLQLLGRRGWRRALRRVQRRLPVVPRVNTPMRARHQISYHYDLGNDFYEHMLDETMTYSCALFTHEGQSLADAQRAKYRAICEHLQLEPGHRVLEIGCGWGGFATYAAEHYGVHVVGLTLSAEQHALGTERVRAAGLEDHVSLELRDYRHETRTFDRIASIEMLEAVGSRQLPTFFRTVDRLLEPDGLACVQVIGFQDAEYSRQLRVRGWIREYVFPGGMLPSLTALTRAMTRASTLQVETLREIGHNYAPTLAAWRGRVLDHPARMRELGCDEEFVRAWHYYLAFCEAGFRSRTIRTMQLTLTRAMNDSLPPSLGLP